MDAVEFERRLVEASVRATVFAREFVTDVLPDAVRYEVRLRVDETRSCYPDEVVYPEDSARWDDFPAVARAEVVALLWRAGRVPVYVDTSVVGATDAFTRVALYCAGKFGPEARLLHWSEGIPPFHVSGPSLPAGWTAGRRFRLGER